MEDDERREELDCITAIFPEIVIDPNDPFSASIELPVNPQIPVKVVFPASSDGITSTPPTPPLSADGQVENEPLAPVIEHLESHNLSYLPSLQLRINLPRGYPEEKPPKFKISTNPPWLSREHLDNLQNTGARMWEEAGRGLVVYGFIDHLQQASETAFGLADEGKALEIPQDFKISLLDYDIKATQAAFEKETFDCGVCLDPKKGSVCHRMVDCGHVFCVQCLQDFYNNAITEGDLVSVKCLDPGCAKKRAEASSSKRPKLQLSPSELLSIPLEHEIVTRFVKLKHKMELESDKNTVYCPRQWCQGAAKSKKHRKPDGFEDADADESESEEPRQPQKFTAGKDLLAICEDCSFAFCSRCYQGWHGELQICIPRVPTGEMTDEDKASLEYLKLHSTPCPTCSARAQKTHGCNHMICFKCTNHFCYLCSAWLEPSNPYKHYNDQRTHCYMRLWELEDGDGDEADRQVGRELLRNENPEDVDHEVLDAVLENDVGPAVVEEPPDPIEPVPQGPMMQREGALVLRINHIPRVLPAAPVVPDAPPQPGRRNRQGPPQHRRGGNGHQAPRRNARPVVAPEPVDVEAAQQAWVQMFVQMALNDEEDQLDWDSDDEDNARWDIPVR